MNDDLPAGRTGDGLSSRLRRSCDAQIAAIRTHPWITGAGNGTLTPAQISTWAGQDLLWGQWWGPVMTAAATAGPAQIQAAFKLLDDNMDTEFAWLRDMASSAPQFPGADRIWPSYLGYATWARQVSADFPLRALVIAWACEASYHDAFTTVRDAGPQQPWAQWAAGENWGSAGFAAMMADMSAGLDAAYAAAEPLTEAALLEDLIDAAQQTYRWEAECWTAVYEGRGWPQ